METPETAQEKKTGEQWLESFEGTLGRILDHDGWRLRDGVSFTETPITLTDFHERYNQCTVMNLIARTGHPLRNHLT